jgi:hypothetical protein
MQGAHGQSSRQGPLGGYVSEKAQDALTTDSETSFY